MNRQFALEPTPAIARQIMRLKKLVPDTEVAPEIEALAEQGVLTDEDREGLSKPSQSFLQDLLDFDLRLIGHVQNRIILSSRIDVWLEPVLRAAKLRGVTSIAFVDCEHFAISTAKAQAERAGLEAHTLNHAYSIMEEDCTVPRSSVLVIPFENSIPYAAGGGIRQVLPLALEFKRTIILADTLGANSTRLFPRLPSLLSVFNDKKGEFAEMPTRQIAFLFNTSYALSRLDGSLLQN